MSKHVKTVAILAAHAGKAEDLREMLESMVSPSRAEPGNLQYNLWQVDSDSSSFVLDEIYVDRMALDAHRATPHFQNYLSRIAGLADRTVLMLESLDVVYGKSTEGS